MNTLPVSSYFAEPITVQEVIFPRLETDLMIFSRYFNLFSPHVRDTRGTEPLRINQKYEVSLVPIALSTPAAMLAQFMKDQDCIFTGTSGLLHFYNRHSELFTVHRGRYVVSMVDDTTVRQFPRITIPACSNAQCNFGFHTICTGNDFHNSSIALLYKKV